MKENALSKEKTVEIRLKSTSYRATNRYLIQNSHEVFELTFCKLPLGLVDNDF